MVGAGGGAVSGALGVSGGLRLGRPFGGLVGDRHDRLRPGVVTRLAVVARDCDLSRQPANGDRIQDPPVVPLIGEVEWIATHWVNGGTALPTPDQLAQARFADQRHRWTTSD